MKQVSANARPGLSLLEAIVSTAIFVAAMAVIGQLLDDGLRQVEFNERATMGLLRCESKMEEVVAGIQGLNDSAAATPTSYPDDPHWKWSLLVEPTEVEGLLRVSVIVDYFEQWDAVDEEPNYEESLTRLVPDPSFAAASVPPEAPTGTITIPEMLELDSGMGASP